jgi:hypothetical protein
VVALAAFLPDERTISTLARLHGSVTVLRRSNLTGGQTTLFLRDDRGGCSKLSVEYHDVVFKFEIFGLVAEPGLLTSGSNAIDIARIDEWDAIKCLFRFEWERPAIAGEVSIDWEQIVRERGERERISELASALGVSMIGIAFWNSAQGMAVAAITSNDDDPVTLRVCDTAEEIERAVSGTEKVSIEDVHPWFIELERLRHELA